MFKNLVILVALSTALVGCKSQEQPEPAPSPAASMPEPEPRSLAELLMAEREYMKAEGDNSQLAVYLDAEKTKLNDMYNMAAAQSGVRDRYKLLQLFPALGDAGNRVYQIQLLAEKSEANLKELDSKFTDKERSLLLPAPPNTSAKSSMMEQIDRLEMNGFGEWTEEDSIKVVNLLSHPKTKEDQEAIQKQEAFNASNECSTGSCEIIHREYAAAKKIRDGKAASAEEALGIK